MPEKKYFRCPLCGAILSEDQLTPKGQCPYCLAPKEDLIPCDENGNDL